ncbi:MAG TPA: hypothetical protein VHO94_01700 [Oscillospiraceae bacterium]|nr:hypothetical protein [Oscillospiraceae bacterium]
MELQNNCNHRVKMIAVSEKSDELVAEILQKVLEYCGHTVTSVIDETACTEKQVEYLVAPAAEITMLPVNTVPALLILVDFAHVNEQVLSHARDFVGCVMDYDMHVPSSADYFTDCKILTYSTGSDNADFTARYIHTLNGETAFEIVGVGVIGRVRLRDSAIVKASLVAACAAVSCGIPFADVLNALNNIK